MRFKSVIFLIILVLCVPQLALAQSDRGGRTDGDYIEEYIDWASFRPFIEVDYGVSTPRFEGLSGAFNSVGLIELKLGYTGLDSLGEELVKLDEYYTFASYLSDDVQMSDDNEDGKWSGDFTRFGGGNRMGLGFGQDKGFRMYNQNSLNWTKSLPVNYGDMDSDVQAVFDRYGSSFRFGMLSEAGLRMNFSPKFGLSLGAEGAVVYPRHVFWPWLGSVAIYAAAEGAIETFTEQIVSVSPVAGPIIQFLLKSGVSLGYYLLVQQDMNWPFESETPITVGSLKLGATLSF